MWLPSGRLTNPAANAVIIDTGPLSQGARTAGVTLAATVATAVELQHRDAANAATIESQVIAVSAFGFAFLPSLDQFDVAAGERLRVVMVGAVVGNVSASLWTTV